MKQIFSNWSNRNLDLYVEEPVFCVTHTNGNFQQTHIHHSQTPWMKFGVDSMACDNAQELD